MNTNTVNHVVDCTADAPLFHDWKVVYHDTSLGRLDLSSSFLQPYLNSSFDLYGSTAFLRGQELPSLNANVCDYLRNHPELHLADWVGERIHCWGTLYCSADGKRLFLPYVQWDGREWELGAEMVDIRWRIGCSSQS